MTPNWFDKYCQLLNSITAVRMYGIAGVVVYYFHYICHCLVLNLNGFNYIELWRSSA